MKRALLLTGICAAVLATTASPSFAVAPTFSDIKGHWAEQDILDMAKTGIVSGYPDGTFHPDDPVNVDEFVVMALNSVSEVKANGKRDWADWWFDKLLPWQLENMLTIAPYTGFKFQIDPNYWANRYIVEAQFMHILNPQEPSDAPLTRRYAATIMLKLLYHTEEQLDGNYVKMRYGAFSDVTQKDSIFSIYEAYVSGLMSGYPDGTFQPNQTITRAEALALIKRMNDPSKRTPHLPNVDQVPHATVPYRNGSYTIVFENQEIFQDYQSILQASKLSKGTVYQEDMGLYFFDNDGDRKRFLALSYRYYDLDPFHSLLIYIPGYDQTRLEMFISQNADALAKHEEAWNAVLASLFGADQQAAKAKIDESLQMVREGVDVKETITLNGRNVKMETAVNSKTGQNVGLSLSMTR